MAFGLDSHPTPSSNSLNKFKISRMGYRQCLSEAKHDKVFRRKTIFAVGLLGENKGNHKVPDEITQWFSVLSGTVGLADTPAGARVCL